MKKDLGNYSWDYDAKAYKRRITLADYDYIVWSQILQHLRG